MNSTIRQILLNVLKICVPIAVYILIWQVLSMRIDSSLLLPSPKETWGSIKLILGSAEGWKILGTTLFRIIRGYLFGCVAGVLLAVLTSHFLVMDWFLNPLRSLIKTTPITSFALILLVSVQSDRLPVIVAMIVVIPMIWQTTEEAIRGRDQRLEEMSKLFLSPWKKLRYVSIPQILPHFLATASTALGFAWKAVITAEILAFPKVGIGRQMQNIKIYYDMADLFAWTLIVIAFSVVIESIFRNVIRIVRRHYD